MKQSLYVLLFLFLYALETKAQSPVVLQKDTLPKKYRWFITTYPSSIVTGDISLGAEFSYKRIRQEVALFYKTYNVIDHYYYDKGCGANYYLKYNIVQKNNFLLSVDLGYVFRKVRFENKIIPLQDDKGKPVNFYKADRWFTKSGVSFGISTLMKMAGRFYLGFNACYDFTTIDYRFVVKEHISGTKLTVPGTPPSELSLPFVHERHGKRFSGTFLVKIAYEL